MKLPIDKEWFEKRAAAEGDLEIGAGSHKLTMTLNLTDAEIATLEQVALEALPAWARDRITVMRAALLAIRDADDIHPDSSTHDVEQSRHRFRDIARQALAGYAPPPQPNMVGEERPTSFMNLVSDYGLNPTQGGFDEIYRRYLADCDKAAANALARAGEAVR